MERISEDVYLIVKVVGCIALKVFGAFLIYFKPAHV